MPATHITFATVLQEVAHAEIIRALKVEQAKELTKLRQEFELQARELGSKYEKKMKMLRDDLELRRKQEIHEIEEHKVGMHSCSHSRCMQLLRQRQHRRHQQREDGAVISSCVPPMPAQQSMDATPSQPHTV